MLGDQPELGILRCRTVGDDIECESLSTSALSHCSSLAGGGERLAVRWESVVIKPVLTSRPGERRDDSGLEDNAITGLIRFCSVGGLDGRTTGISVSGLVLMEVMLPPFCERDLECPSLYDAAWGCLMDADETGVAVVRREDSKPLLELLAFLMLRFWHIS